MFFPFAYSSVCTAELCNIRDDLTFYNEMDAEILAISVDSLFTLNKFKKDQNLDFQLLSDFNKDVSRSYGALFETFAFDMKGVSKRSAFVIDPNGYMRYAEVLEHPPELPNFDAIKNTLKEIALAKA